MTTPIRKTRSASKKLDLNKVQQETQWRTWFPEGLKLDARKVIPDVEVDRMLDAFERFCSEAIMIKRPGERAPFILRDAQRDTVRRWMTHRNTITLKARQIGFSTLVAAFALWCAMGGGDRQIYLLSRRQEDSISLLNKAKFAFKSMPLWARERAPGVIDRTQLRMTFENESFIQSSPAAGDPITGETAFLVVVDEWAKFPDQEAAWASIEPVADIGGRVVGLSTAKGEGSFFHRMWVGATTQSNNFHPIFHPWWAVPERDDAWYQDKKENLEPWQLFQEYPSNPEEAFIGSGNPFFNLDVLREMRPKEPIGQFFVTGNSDGGNRFLCDEIQGGEYTMYVRPSPRRTYVIGADIAQGLEHGDWTVAYVMDAETGDIVGVYRGKPEPDEFANILVGLGYMHNYALLAPEVNNHGRSTVDHLKNLKYQRIYRRRTKLKRGYEAPTETLGWLTTHGNKHDICLELGVWLRTHNVPHEPTIAELKTFRAEQKGERIKLQGSPHDDCVLALAITVEARKYAIANNIGTTKTADVQNSIDWWVKKLDNGGKKRRRISNMLGR